MKVDTHIYEYEHCGQCPYSDSTWKSLRSKVYCVKTKPKRLLIRDNLWGDIPAWCPLETKGEENVKV